MLDQEATGQQSLSCQYSAPLQRARLRRQCSTADAHRLGLQHLGDVHQGGKVLGHLVVIGQVGDDLAVAGAVALVVLHDVGGHVPFRRFGVGGHGLPGRAAIGSQTRWQSAGTAGGKSGMACSHATLPTGGGRRWWGCPEFRAAARRRASWASRRDLGLLP